MTTLLVATSVFPLGGGGRIEKFVKLLPDCGVRPIVVSPWETQSADTQRLLANVYPPSLEKYYVRSFGPTYFAERLQARSPGARHYRLLKALSLPERLAYVPDHMVRWIPFGIRQARKLIREHGIRVVLTSSPPESTHLVGLWLKRYCGVQWIADFRDLWTARTVLYQPATPLHDRFIRRLERTILQSADHVIANTDENMASYVDTFGVDPRRVSVIPNGFDRDDVVDPARLPHDDDVFLLSYMGNLSKHDLPWRTFLRGLKMFCDRAGTDRIRFVQCGFLSREVEEYLEELNLGAVVVRQGDMTHHEAMRITASTHLRVVLLADNSYSRAMVPAKLYNYLIMNGPILAVSPTDGAAARVLRETRAGTIVAPTDDGTEVCRNLLDYYQRWRRGERLVEPCEERVAAYDRRRHASALADIVRTLDQRASERAPESAARQVAFTGRRSSAAR